MDPLNHPPHSLSPTSISSSETPQQCSIHHLPPEILYKIFSLLRHFPEDLSAASSACRLWNASLAFVLTKKLSKIALAIGNLTSLLSKKLPHSFKNCKGLACHHFCSLSCHNNCMFKVRSARMVLHAVRPLVVFI